MQQKQVVIYKAQFSDLETLSVLSSNTFFDSFANDNTEEDMQAYVEATYSVESLKRQMGTPGSQFWLASLEGVAIGYIKVNFGEAQSDLKDGNALELERIYVDKNYQGLKVGYGLLKKVCEIAQEVGLKSVWLGVWEKNEKAIRFYEQAGFERVGEHTFMLGSDPQNDLLFRLDLDIKGQ